VKKRDMIEQMIKKLDERKIHELEAKALQARKLVLTSLYEAGSGHPGGSLGMTDIFVAFYFHILHHNPQNPDLPDRDRLILSNGHICPIRYVCMAMAGYFPVAELRTLRKINSRLQGHPHRTNLPGLETTSGPLGEGLSQGIGIALAAKLDKKNYHVYVLTSDGEHEEGNIWESIMFAAKEKLDNLTVVIDRNNIQIDGTTEEVMPLESLRAKYEAFNWNVLEVDGHDMKLFVEAVQKAHTVKEKPTVIIARTIPGKGVNFMENECSWHGKVPNKEQMEIAMKELDGLEKYR
jgi:transketolase